MSSVEKYQSLKIDGSWIDRVKYVISLSNKSEIENNLKQSFQTSYDDLQMFIFLSTSMKNVDNLLTIFQTTSLPVKQRCQAIKSWLQLQTNIELVESFILETVNDQNIPRYLKNQILRILHRIDNLKKSSSFFYNLAKRLTEQNNHEQYNLDAHLAPYCTEKQVLDLFSQWSIERLEQINTSSALYSKLIRYQPLILIHLIQGDLNKKKSNYEKFSNYFSYKQTLKASIVKKKPKEFLCLFLQYVNQLEKQHQYIPSTVDSQQNYLFKKAPNQMIELFTKIASNRAGSIKFQFQTFPSSYQYFNFLFPYSFSIENCVQFFLTLYDTCRWSTNYLPRLLQSMLTSKDADTNLSTLKKERIWFYDIVVCQRIGKDVFIRKLLDQGDERTLELLDGYDDLTTPLSVHLLSIKERQRIVSASEHLSLLRYQTMTKEIFDKFISLFKQISSDVDEREKNYSLLFRCALATNEEAVRNVLQWIEKRFTNEQLNIIENFIETLSSVSAKFNLKILPKNFDTISTIINFAFDHLQRSSSTLDKIFDFGIVLLKRTENYLNKQAKQQIQQFAIQLIQQCYEKESNIRNRLHEISYSYPETQRLILNVLITKIFPKLTIKSQVNQFANICSIFEKESRTIPEIDSFLDTFFRTSLPSSSSLQSAFNVEAQSSFISLYLKDSVTRLERVQYLLTKLSRVFFLNKTVQRIVLRSQQYRQLIDQLIADEKLVTIDKLSDEQSQFVVNTDWPIHEPRLPGLDIDLLNSSFQYLTGKQQEHITKIILYDYLQDEEVRNVDKLKSFRVLRRLPRTYNKTIKKIHENSSSEEKNPAEQASRPARGADGQSLKDILICLPATFDFNSEKLLEYFQFLKTKLNAANAKYVSDAMLSLSRRLPDQFFLTSYNEFISSEQFSKLGITANKQVLRLLIQYSNQTNLIETSINSWWQRKPHQDIRACLVLIVLHFLANNKSNEENSSIWNILNEATEDEYRPVIQCLFSSERDQFRWPLFRLRNSSQTKFERFVNGIQTKILDHSKSLEIRSDAWSAIDSEFVDAKTFIEKIRELCCLFDKNGNTLWSLAFNKLIDLFKQNRISSVDTIVDILKQMMSCRKEIDSNQNGLDNQHDLPVYHRVQQVLMKLKDHIDQFESEKRNQIQTLTSIILRFDKTLAPTMGRILIKIVRNKEELEQILKVFEDNLPEYYFKKVLTEFSTLIHDENSCPFVQQLNLDEKLDLAQWFIKEKNRPSLIFDLLKETVFNQPAVDRQRCQNLIQEIRQTDDLCLREQTMEYTVPWN